MVSDEIITVIDELAKKLGVTIDWSQKNIMPYIQDLYSRYIQYEISTTMFWLVISILLIGISIACWCRYNQKLKNGVGEKYRNENGKLFAMLIAILAGLLLMFGVHDLITLVTFPEKMILKDLTDAYESLKG